MATNQRTDAQWPHFTCAVPTLDRHEVLFDLLDDLRSQSVRPTETLVIDQSASIPAAVRQKYVEVARDLNVRLFHVPPRGSGGARNLAIALAAFPIVIFLDDDVRLPSRELLEGHLRWYEHDHIAAVDGGYLPYPGTTDDTRVLVDLQRRDLVDALTTTYISRTGPRPVVGLCGGNFSARREALLGVGGFDERFGLGEDRELGIRLWKAGCVVLSDGQLRVEHRKHPRGGLRRAPSTSRFPYATAAVDPLRYLYVMLHFHRRQAREVLLDQLRSSVRGGPRAWAAAPLRGAAHLKAYRRAREMSRAEAELLRTEDLPDPVDLRHPDD